MEKVTGRSDDMLIIRGVNVFPTQIEEVIVAAPQLAPHYQLEVRRDGSLDSLEIVVEAAPGLTPPDQQAWSAAAAELRHQVKALVGVTATVRVVGVGENALSEGKAVRIIDHREK
jgi:phenylacetate-CoA ligase